jgi:hypothetical protein
LHGVLSRRPLRIAACAAWIVIVVALQLFRQSGPAATDTIWAEDGHLFLTAALNYDHPADLFFAPAGKYMHAAPRMLASVAAGFSLTTSAWFLAMSSAVVVAGLSLFVFFASKPILASVGSRALVSAMMVLLAPVNVESLNNSANLHYFLTFGAFWALVWEPRSWVAAAIACIVVAAAVLSDPITVVMVPVAAFALIRRANGRHMLVAGVFLVGLAFHGWVWFTADQPGRYSGDPSLPIAIQEELERRAFAPQAYAESDPLDLPRLYGLRVIGSVWGGNDLLASAWRSLGDTVAYSGLVLLFIVVAVAIARWGLREKWRIALLLGYSLVFFIVPVGIRGTEHLAPHPNALSLAGSRYVIIPALFVVALVAVCLERTRGDGWRASPWVPVRVGLALLVPGIALTDLRDPNLRSLGPTWGTELSSADERCARQDGFVEIGITPPGGFSVLVNCDRVRRDS